MAHHLTYCKVCRTAAQAAKERTILRLLQTSPLKHFSPVLVEVQRDPMIVEMSHIEGSAPRPEDIGEDLLNQLGTTLRQLHQFRPCTTFGSLDADLGVPRCFATFTDFLEAQIEKWASWHSAQPGSYLHAYATWLHHELGTLGNYFSSLEPIFCHGDIDTKNLILQEGELVGLIDWEHAGSYCLAWELRKLPRTLRHDWQWETLCTAYDGTTIQDHCALVQAIRFLDAADLLGRLRWCLIRGLRFQEADTVRRMHIFLP